MKNCRVHPTHWLTCTQAFTRSIELESSEEQLVDEEGLAAYLADAIVVPLHLIACYCVEIHRADAVTRTTSRRWRGASEI